jgi:hypothetical protein
MESNIIESWKSTKKLIYLNNNNKILPIMDKLKIINHWSYQKSNESITLHDKLIFELANFYSQLNNIELVNLNLLDESFKLYYWFLCRKTGELYFLNLIIDEREYQLTKDIVQALSEVNRYIFKQINFEITTKDSNPTNSNNYLNVIKLSNKDTNYFYCLINMSVDEKSVINIMKPSRSVRYLRRQILNESNSNKKRPNSVLAKNDFDEKIYYNQELNERPTKKPRKDNDDFWKDMISASSIRNYMLNDPLIDFLKEYNIHTLEDTPSKIPNSRKNVEPNVDTFTKHIMDAGIEFENELIKILKNDHQVVKVADHFQSKNKEKLDETIKLMKEGIPIIYQAVLHNYENKTFGLSDLLVRSDYLNKLMGYQVISEDEEKLGSTKLGTKWHYKVIDIKHSQIPLREDGIHILNSDSIPFYKGQLYIYTLALNKLQGIEINKAFIWGKKYYYESCKTKYEITNFLNKLGIIDYDNIDSEYVRQTNNAIEWVRTVRNEGANWTLLPIPCRKELFPNMKNEKDGQWRKVKNELNEKIYEITAIWNCGVKKRESAHQSNVYGWNDPKCTSKIMGFNQNSKIAYTVDSILNINRQNIDLMRPTKISYDRDNWIKPEKNTMEFYLDFETLNSNFGSIIKDGIISYDSNQFVFMIGVGYSNNDKWIFKSFVMDEKHHQSELEMFQDFYKYVNDILITNKKKIAKFYHWSFAEPSVYHSFKNRNSNYKFKDSWIKFYDLNKVFTSEPVTVKGALDFSLKTIAKALNKHGLIDSCWNNTSPCSNGLTAMILANNLYESIDENTDIKSEPIMKEIIYYNEIDCKVMWEIHNLIKMNF